MKYLFLWHKAQSICYMPCFLLARHWEHVNKETAFYRTCQGFPLYRTTSTPLIIHYAMTILTIGTTFHCAFFSL